MGTYRCKSTLSLQNLAKIGLKGPFWARKVIILALVLIATPAWSVIEPYFYSVTKGDQVSYVLGTFHEGISVTELPFYVLERLRGSRQLILEVDTEGVVLAGRNRAGTTLSSNLSPEAWIFLKQRLGRYYSEGQIDRMEGWFAARELLASLYVPNLRRRQKLDNQLQRLAMLQGKPLWFLAPVNEHISIYQERLEDIEQLARSSELREFAKEIKLQWETMLDQYRRHQITYDTPEQPHPRRTQVIDQRNQKWMPTLKGAFLVDTSFVAVGVAHLSGPTGLLNLLENEGFKIEPFGECDENILRATSQSTDSK